MSVLERLESIKVGFELPFWDGLKWWVRIRPKPLFMPRLPTRFMSAEAMEWIKKRPRIVKR